MKKSTFSLLGGWFVVLASAAVDACAKDGRLSQLIAGLTATVDILTGQRSVLRYLIKPIARGLTGALNER